MAFSDLPVYTQFHVAIGLTAICFAALAIAVRLPFLPSTLAKYGSLHGVFGGLYIVLSVFMPITSNWIWPRLGTPWMVIFFIATMFISMALGVICIKAYKHVNRHAIALEVIVSRGSTSPAPSAAVEKHAEEVLEAQEHPEQSSTIIQSHYESLNSPARQCVWLKHLHAFLMVYSFVMILGAAGAFGSNARTHNFPYKPTETNQLYGRCFDRNLTDAAAPAWLTSLDCGTNAWCEVSATDPSQSNPYYQNP